MAAEETDFADLDVKVRGTDLGYGEGQIIESQQDIVDALDEADEEALNAEDFLPGDDLEEPGPEPLAVPTLTGLDALLFGDSIRLDEPVTAGAPVGPGPNGLPPLDREQELGRFVRRMAQAPDAPAEVKAFAERFERGI